MLSLLWLVPFYWQFVCSRLFIKNGKVSLGTPFDWVAERDLKKNIWLEIDLKSYFWELTNIPIQHFGLNYGHPIYARITVLHPFSPFSFKFIFFVIYFLRSGPQTNTNSEMRIIRLRIRLFHHQITHHGRFQEKYQKILRSPLKISHRNHRRGQRSHQFL